MNTTEKQFICGICSRHSDLVYSTNIDDVESIVEHLSDRHGKIELATELAKLYLSKQRSKD